MFALGCSAWALQHGLQAVLQGHLLLHTLPTHQHTPTSCSLFSGVVSACAYLGTAGMLPFPCLVLTVFRGRIYGCGCDSVKVATGLTHWVVQYSLDQAWASHQAHYDLVEDIIALRRDPWAELLECMDMSATAAYVTAGWNTCPVQRITCKSREKSLQTRPVEASDYSLWQTVKCSTGLHCDASSVLQPRSLGQHAKMAPTDWPHCNSAVPPGRPCQGWVAPS